MGSESKEREQAIEGSEAKTPKKAWAMLAIIYLASIGASLCQFKTPPLASWIIPAFGMDAMSFGMQMSIVGIVGLILAFPAAYICRGLGAKNTVLLSVACLAVGSFGGIISTNYTVLMVTRLLEGIGLGLIGVVGPTCVSVWFPDKTRGIALGIWATWVPLAMVLIYAVAPLMAQSMGWQSVFILCGCIAVVAFILVAAFFKMPEGKAADFGAAGSFKDTLRLLKNGNLWLLGFVMCIFLFIGSGALSTYYNTYLMEVHSFDPASASGMVSIFTAIGVVTGPLAGALSDRLAPGKKRWGIVLTFAVYLVGLLFAWPQPGSGAIASIWTFAIIGGIAAGAGAGSIRPLAPIVAGGGAMGAAVSMAMIQFMQNLGVAVGSPVFGAAMGAFGWSAAGMGILATLCVVAMVLAAFINPDRRKKKA